MDRGSRASTPPKTYRRILTLARGGMGTVELALRSDGSFRRLYAIKRLREGVADDADVRTMFLDEARVAGLLRHPNVVSVLDVGEDERGPFLVMELIDGVPLSSLLRALARSDQLLPLPLVLRVVADAARGLHAAHELRTPEGVTLGLVHRDVSPQNILLGFDGSVRVTDFGVAKAYGRLTRTDSGLLKGKLGYMSPEQLRFHDVDRRSDLFSLGIVLYELLTSSRLYGNDDEVPAPRRILEESPPDPGERRSDLPAPLVELVFELLAKDPDTRPDSARRVAERLDAIRVPIEAQEGTHDLADYLAGRFADLRAEREAAIAEGLARLEREPTTDSTTDSPVARRAVPLAIGLGVALVLAIAVAVAVTASPPAEPAPGRASTAPAEPTEGLPVPAREEPADPVQEGSSEQPAVDPAGEVTEATGAPQPPRRAKSARRRRPPARMAEDPPEGARETAEGRSPELWDW